MPTSAIFSTVFSLRLISSKSNAGSQSPSPLFFFFVKKKPLKILNLNSKKPQKVTISYRIILTVIQKIIVAQIWSKMRAVHDVMISDYTKKQVIIVRATSILVITRVNYWFSGSVCISSRRVSNPFLRLQDDVQSTHTKNNREHWLYIDWINICLIFIKL